LSLENVAVVLSRPKLSENIGTAARAAANMGLGRLIVVQPFRLEEEIMMAAATRAGQELIRTLTVFDDFDQALAGFHFVVGTTARRGSKRGPFHTPRQAAPGLIQAARENRVALVFGAERSGLTTDELRRCQTVVCIPTASASTSSLNLAQAVLVLGYELLLARNQAPPERLEYKPAPVSELQDMYDHFQRTMVRIGFLPEDNTEHWLMSFKRLFNRTGLTHGDCNLVRGMCRQIDWAVDHGRPTHSNEDEP